MTYRGWLEALIELIPRIWILWSAPGSPVDPPTRIPATFPCKDFTKDSFCADKSSDLTTEADPVKEAFFVVPYATTITSSSCWLSLSNTIFNIGLITTSWLFIPTYEITRVFAELGTSKENAPSKSVTVPTIVPFTTIDAPIIGSLSSAEITVPVTFVV